MTFKKFEQIFHSKYPNGSVFAHSKFGGTELNRKTTVIFEHRGKCFLYYGAYEDVLCKIGINCISKERFDALEARLACYIEQNGTDDFFGGTFDWTSEIEQLTREIEQYKTDYIIA